MTKIRNVMEDGVLRARTKPVTETDGDAELKVAG
jgi:hypothetical protein